jgi:O-antigen ligase
MQKLLNLENLIYCVIIFLPAYLVQFSFFGVPTNILEMAILLIFILWLFRKGYRSMFLEPYKKYTLPLALIFLGLILSVLVNKNYAVGLGIIKGWFIVPVLFVFSISQIIKKENIINIFFALYLSAFFASIIAIFYLMLGNMTYDGRLQAFFNSPNYLAMYLAPALIILAQVQSAKCKVQSYSLKLKIIFLISGLIILTTFYFTYSYASWIAVALSLIVVTIFKNKKVIKNKTTVMLLLMIILLFAVQANSEKLLNLKNYNRSSLQSRMMIWRSAEKMLKENFIFGIGPGNFQEKYLKYQKYYPPYLEWAVPHPHNLYLSFWLYSGILGLTGFVWLVGLWFRDAIYPHTKNLIEHKNKKGNCFFGVGVKKSDNTVKFIVLGIMAYILIHGLVDTTYFKNDLAIIFWLNFLALKL